MSAICSRKAVGRAREKATRARAERVFMAFLLPPSTRQTAAYFGPGR
jgi:hypothetical protein